MKNFINIDDFILALFSFILLFLLYHVMTKVFPKSKSVLKTEKSLKELREKYSKIDRNQLLVFLIFALIFMILLYLGLSIFIDFKLSFIPHTNILIKPQPILVFVVAFFIGILLATILTNWLTKRKLNSSWYEYLAYSNLSYRINYLKFFKVFLFFLSFLSLVVLYAVLDSFSSFGHNEIKWNGLFSIGTKSYQYSDIKSIKDIDKLKAISGDIVDEPYFIIEFNDGNQWNSRNDGFIRYEQNCEIIEFVTSKVSIEPIEMEFNNE